MSERSPFVAILPGGVPMAFAVGTPLSDVITIATHCARDEGGDVQIVREEGSRIALGTVHPDGRWVEA